MEGTDRNPDSRRTSALARLLLVGCLGTALCACDEPPAVADESVQATPTRGGELRLIQEEPASLDPVLADSVYEGLPLNQIFDGLVEIDPGLNVAPGLAATWRISRDGRLYEFHLREGVRFHDGEPLSADDVVFTIRRVLRSSTDRRSPVHSYLVPIDGATEFAEGRSPDLPGVEAIDPLTVRIRLNRPYPSFLEVLAMDGVRIVPEHVVAEVGDEQFGRSPVGTGPFRFDAWTARGLRLVANRGYFGAKPHLRAVNLLFFEDDERDLGLERYLTGELDALQPGTDQLEGLQGRADTRISKYQELSLSFLGMQCSSTPLDDPLVRRAIAHAIDRDVFIRQAPATRRRAVGLLPPGLWGYSPSQKSLEHDRGRARQLLLEAGHAGGVGLSEIPLLTPANSVAARDLAERIQADLAEVGIRIRVVPVSWGELSRRTVEHEAPMFLMAWIADLPDPDTLLRTLFEPGGSANYFAFDDRETADLLERGAGEMNQVRRADVYRQIERRILEQAPIVPLYHTLGVVAARSTVHGFEPGPLGVANVNLERVWIEPRGR